MFTNFDESSCVLLPNDRVSGSLAVQSWDRWIVEEAGCTVDDITVLLAHLQIEAIDTV